MYGDRARACVCVGCMMCVSVCVFVCVGEFEYVCVRVVGLVANIFVTI
jgi:hypothetical protein